MRGHESEEVEWSTRTIARTSLVKGIWEHSMDEWSDSQPIYRQLRDRVVAMILDGVLKEGDPLPSVRNVAAEYRVNPLTVLKGYQQLVDEKLVESKRGRGMFINAGARILLLQGERQKFLAEQWPKIYATIQRLGLTPEELLDAAATRHSSSATGSNTAEEKSKP
jgi:GntR family transcriptional regulator